MILIIIVLIIIASIGNLMLVCIRSRNKEVRRLQQAVQAQELRVRLAELRRRETLLLDEAIRKEIGK